MESEQMEAVRTLVDFAQKHIDDENQNTHPADMSDLEEAVQTVLKYLDGDDYLYPEEIQACKEQDEEQAGAAGDCTQTHDHTLQGGAYCD